MNVDHYDLLAWVFNLCLVIAALVGFDIALRIYELWFTD